MIEAAEGDGTVLVMQGGELRGVWFHPETITRMRAIKATLPSLTR